eukprot:4222075-Pleurochrysis_carterae.AAC.1
MPVSPLTVPYVTSSLPEWPDARMISFLTHGVCFEADLPLQIVLFPHLISFPNGFASLKKKVRRMQSRAVGLTFSPTCRICPSE